MSKPRYDWWGYILNLIKHYPEGKKKLDEMHRTPVTPKYAAIGGGSGPGNPVACAAVKELDEQQM